MKEGVGGMDSMDHTSKNDANKTTCFNCSLLKGRLIKNLVFHRSFFPSCLGVLTTHLILHDPYLPMLRLPVVAGRFPVCSKQLQMIRVLWFWLVSFSFFLLGNNCSIYSSVQCLSNYGLWPGSCTTWQTSPSWAFCHAAVNLSRRSEQNAILGSCLCQEIWTQSLLGQWATVTTALSISVYRLLRKISSSVVEWLAPLETEGFSIAQQFWAWRLQAGNFHLSHHHQD